MNNWAVVVPTNRPDRFADFISSWGHVFKRHNVYLIVVQDLPEHNPEIADAIQGRGIAHEMHDWGTITAKHIPHRTDMVRSWGIYRAWATGREYTLTLDDDVSPSGDLFAAYEKVFRDGAPHSRYFDVGALTSFGGHLRGFPFKDRKPAEVVVQYGGWDGILDYDAPTQLAGVKEQEWFTRIVVPVPVGAAVTTCIMNAAWRTEYAPIMWQLPLFDGRFNRFGDIWSGLLQKRTLDVTGGVMVVNGNATVQHVRASDPVANLEREAPGIGPNEGLWDELCRRQVGDYWQVTDIAYSYFRRLNHEYGEHFRVARDEWKRLFRQ